MKRRHPEHALQVSVAHMLSIVLDPEHTWWSAIDHGVGRLGKAEAGVRKARGVKRGLPDFIIMCQPVPNQWAKHLIIGIELKVGSGKQTPDQLLVADIWRRMGHGIYVARSLEHVQQILEYCEVPMRSRMRLFPRGAYHEPPLGLATARHQRTRRRRKSEDHLPLVLADAAQKN